LSPSRERPRKIFTLDLANTEFIAQEGCVSLLRGGIDLDLAFTEETPIGAFGGEGFILQRLSGRGCVSLTAAAIIMEMTLAPGEVVQGGDRPRVGFESTVNYDIALAAA